MAETHEPTGVGKGATLGAPPPNPPGSLGSGMELADEEPKARKKREPVPVIVCRLESGQLVPMVDEENDWREFTSTAEADKWLKNDPEAQEGVEYFILPVQRRVKLKFHTVRKVTTES